MLIISFSYVHISYFYCFSFFSATMELTYVLFYFNTYKRSTYSPDLLNKI